MATVERHVRFRVRLSFPSSLVESATWWVFRDGSDGVGFGTDGVLGAGALAHELESAAYQLRRALAENKL